MDGTRAGDYQALHQDHQEADIAPLLPYGLVIAFTDIFGNRLIKELLMVVTLFPRNRSKLCAPGFKERSPLSIDGAALLGANHVRMDPIAGDAAGVREFLSVDQRY